MSGQVQQFTVVLQWDDINNGHRPGHVRPAEIILVEAVDGFGARQLAREILFNDAQAGMDDQLEYEYAPPTLEVYTVEDIQIHACFPGWHNDTF